MAEAIARHAAATRAPSANRLVVHAFSAGSEPGDAVHPMAIDTLTAHGISSDGLRTKHVSTFLDHAFDYLVAVADRAREVAPVFPGKEALCWGYTDPEQEKADRAPEAFKSLALGLLLRIRLLLDYHAQAPQPPKSIAELNNSLLHFTMAQTRSSLNRTFSSSASLPRVRS
jgi:protein-tyrosine-phosphatase